MNDMRYVKVVSTNGAYLLEIDRCPRPTVGEHDALMKVAAAGVNRADLYQAEGRYPSPEGASTILGLEVAGEVVDKSPRVTSAEIGERVCALLRGGGYAEYVAVPQWRVLPIPKGYTMVQAAAIPETFFTVYLTLFQLAGLRAGETVLVHGGASGIGTTAIQLARAFGANVVVTAGSEEKCRLCTRLGAAEAIDYTTDDFVSRVRELTSGRGVDVVLDIIGGEYLQKNLSALAVKGRMVSLAFLKGARVELNCAPLLMKNLTLIGSTLRSQPEETISALAQSLKSDVWPLFDTGVIAPVIDSVYPMNEATTAHDRMRNFLHMGKMVVTVG